MRIAIIFNSFPEISEKFLLNAVIGYIKAGADITVFAAHRPESGIRHGQYEEYDVVKYTRYVGVPRSLRRRFVAAPALFLRLFARSPKAALEALRSGKYRTVAQNMKLLYFGIAFANERFDIVHCHFGMNGLIGSYLKECGFTKRLVTTFHGSDINTYPKKHGLDVYRTLYRTADLITANTAFTKSKIIANGCPESLVYVLPVGLVAAEYADNDRTRVIPDTLLTVGRLEEKKGHRYALEAVALVRKTIPGIRYFIAGDGSLRTSLKAYAAELGIAGSCHFLGVCASDRVKELYRTCAVFTLSSITASNGDMEGQGLVIQEAQACGLPVVTTRHNGIPDGLLDGISGFLVEEKDSATLAEKILLLFHEPGLCTRMGTEGRAFVLSGYDIDALTAKILKLYGELT